MWISFIKYSACRACVACISVHVAVHPHALSTTLRRQPSTWSGISMLKRTRKTPLHPPFWALWMPMMMGSREGKAPNAEVRQARVWGERQRRESQLLPLMRAGPLMMMRMTVMRIHLKIPVLILDFVYQILPAPETIFIKLFWKSKMFANL